MLEAVRESLEGAKRAAAAAADVPSAEEGEDRFASDWFWRREAEANAAALEEAAEALAAAMEALQGKRVRRKLPMPM